LVLLCSNVVDDVKVVWIISTNGSTKAAIPVGWI
jgi:hypothetical protein